MVQKNIKKSSKPDINLELTKEVRKLTAEVTNLKDLEFMKVFKHPWKFMWFSFWKGVMVGFGSVLGATVVVAVFVYLLAQISVVPFVGNFVEKVIDEVGASESKESSDKTFFEKYDEATKDSSTEIAPENLDGTAM